MFSDHARGSDRLPYEIVEDAINFHATGDHLIKLYECPDGWDENDEKFCCAGPIVTPQGTCTKHYWSEEDLALSEELASRLVHILAYTLTHAPYSWRQA